MAALLGALLAASPVVGRVAAYNDDGHFYTAVSVAHSRLPGFGDNDLDSAVLLTLCAQLPDLSREFDAVKLRTDLLWPGRGYLWGAFSWCSGEDVCHMVTVHHYLHGLTGGEAEAVTKAAEETLGALVPRTKRVGELDPNQVGAAGFAVHLLGDSFAHRRLDNPSRMYPPGRGHLADGHNPDFILYKTGSEKDPYRERWEKNYLRYAQTIDRALGATTAPARWTALQTMLQRLYTNAQTSNEYNQNNLRSQFLDELGTAESKARTIWARYDPTIEKMGSSPTCKDVLQKSAPSSVKDKLNCNVIWDAYKKEAVKAFQRARIPPTCRLDDYWTDGVSPRVPGR